jgi:hypothetical protein
MINAQDAVLDVLRNVDHVSKPYEWAFLHTVLVCVSTEAELDAVQRNFLNVTLLEVVCDMHQAVIMDRQKSSMWAMAIATWVNGAHVANNTSIAK